MKNEYKLRKVWMKNKKCIWCAGHMTVLRMSRVACVCKEAKRLLAQLCQNIKM